MSNKALCILPFIFLSAFQSIAQSETELLLSDMKRLRMEMINAQDVNKLRLLNDTFSLAVEDFLNIENSFYTQLDSIPFLGDLYSPDGAFRIINWNIPVDDGFYKYFAYLQTHNKKKKSFEIYRLNDRSDSYDRPEHKSMDADSWFGALYYQIIPYKVDKKQEYALLGWDGANPMLNIKLIEVMYFGRNGEPRFGATRFKPGKRMQRRVLFKYAEDASMSLRYHPKKDMIIFDHLIPMKQGMEGIYEFYGPDFTYDAFELTRKGKWEFVENVDVRQPKNDKDWNTPTRKNLPTDPKNN